MRTREELAWAAGLFDGEGCFEFRPQITKGNRYRATIAMKDRDLVERFGAAVGFGSIGFKEWGTARTPMWFWRVQSFHHVQALGVLLWPWLGERRRARVVQMLRYAADFYSNGLRKRSLAITEGVKT